MIKLKLKQTILDIPKGTVSYGYGAIYQDDCHLFGFDGEYGTNYSAPYSPVDGSEDQPELQTEFTVSLAYAKRYPELFEIIEELEE